MILSIYEVIIPLMNHSKEEGRNGNTDLLIEEMISTQDYLPIISVGEVQYTPKISLIPEYLPLSNEILTPVGAIKFTFDILSIHPTFRTQFDNTKDDYLSSPLYLYSRHSYTATIQNQMFYFLCLTQVAYPFSIQSFSGEIHVDGQFYKLITHFNNPYKVWFDGDIRKDKLTRHVSLVKLYNWLSKCDISFDEKSQTNIQKLLFAITYIFYAGEDDEKILFWSMYALEAFYCNSRNSITEQLRERIKMFLDLPFSFSNRDINELYKYRSSFVHGSTNILPAGYNESYINLSTSEITCNKHLLNTLIIILFSAQKLVQFELESVEFGIKHTVNLKSAQHNPYKANN